MFLFNDQPPNDSEVIEPLSEETTGDLEELPMEPVGEPVEATFILQGHDISLKMDESGEVLACLPDKCFPIGTGEETFQQTKELLNSLAKIGIEE
ncbi:MAG TPA: hypothetical protein VMW00_06400 [Dehalococcoidales bacterium]|nr:hypothetical protein [Dehalococcoidales bacterium]